MLQPADAEDVVQDTMLRAWEHRAEWQSKESIQAWLVQICKNLVLDRKKRAAFRMMPLESNATGLNPTEPAAHAGSQPDRQFELTESIGLISRLIADLQPPLPDLIRLRDIEGLSYRDIATQLNLTEDQVRVYLHRARTRIREAYARLQGEGL